MPTTAIYASRILTPQEEISDSVILVEGSRIVAIPLTMEVNDMPLYVRYGNAPSVFLDIFKDNLRRALEREKNALTIDVTAHTHVFGRFSGAWVYEACAEIAKANSDVWICTRRQIAEHVLAQLS